MADDSDVLLKFVEQQWVEAKQSEDQRAAITNVILLIVAAVVGFMAQKSLSRSHLLLSSLLIVLGLYGAIASAKLYERHQFHIERLKYWRKKLNELHPKTELEALKELAVQSHNARFPWLKNVRLYYLWVFLHLIIMIAGIVITAVILYKT
jgi:hypothetical protein